MKDFTAKQLEAKQQIEKLEKRIQERDNLIKEQRLFIEALLNEINSSKETKPKTERYKHLKIV